MVIVASTRPGRLAPTVARWFANAVELEAAQRGCILDVADLAEIALPFLDEPDHPSSGNYVHEHTRAWSHRVAAADAFVVVTPDYNYGMPDVLKNALDFLYHEWAWKPVAFISYGNTSAGTRSVQMTKQVVTTLRMVPIGATIALRIADALGGQHLNSNPELEQAATQLFDELTRVATTLRQLRLPDTADSALVAGNARTSA